MNANQKRLLNQHLNHQVARVNQQKAASLISGCIDRYPRTWAQEAFRQKPGRFGRTIIFDVWRQQLSSLREANVTRKHAARAAFSLYSWQREQQKTAR